MGSAMSTVREVYVSTDVEADGPIPGPFSMLSLASAAFDAEGVLLGTFTVNLRTLEGATVHPDTARFWAANPEALAATHLLTVGFMLQVMLGALIQVLPVVAVGAVGHAESLDR